MISSTWGILCVFLFFFPDVHAEDTCAKTISASCTPYQIVVTNITATQSLAEDVLLQCNSQDECLVQNPNEECVGFNYFCTPRHDTLEIGENSHPILKTESLFSLMSEGYQTGKYQDAQNIKCDLKHVGKNRDVIRTMNITMIELSPFAKSTNYCLMVRNSEMEPICSGSENIFTLHGPIKSITGWQIEMKLRGVTMQVPLIRFWMSIDLSPNDDTRYRLECNTHPVTQPTPADEVTQMTSPTQTETEETESGTITIVAVVGTVLVITFVAIFVGVALTCRQNKVNYTRIHRNNQQANNTEADPTHTYVEIDSIRRNVKKLPRKAKSAQGSLLTKEINSRAKSCELLPGSRIHDSILSSPPRENQTDPTTPEEILPRSKSCELLRGSGIQDRKLPSPPRQHHDIGDLAVPHLLFGAIAKDDYGHVDDSKSDNGYLPPRECQQDQGKATDLAKTEKINTAEYVEPRGLPSNGEMEGCDEKDIPAESDDEKVTENAYMSLSHESLVDDGSQSRIGRN